MSEFDESNLESSSSSWSSDTEDTHSIAGRARVRAKLEADIEAFLSQGGQITELDTTLRSDAPRRAEPGFNNRSV
ncbi:hypothetical protein RE428_45210 [Marinobacter nanhaiticus D15-8W]|uniref:Transcriptional regulator SutA RNAP-binding domain-containing protein n=1 Tax=Marinobacter nanhaiticus D15-8W TaxID=626887 RepID=N6WVQ2_9GAMM|nr:hypothetical protein [Marinobacter nanhaiticus]ENO15646.1 hypothetical protein J057_09846 [Marinobacter nanhaiticus D15-8W]BES73503.1 hypothetical protein RE428_45210 [Marinobacter nanhaiticus D15-8W]